jgi:hypothetical protein
MKLSLADLPIVASSKLLSYTIFIKNMILIAREKSSYFWEG